MAKKLATDFIGEIDDPRMAATVMMVSLAQADGAITEREQRTIMDQLGAVLGANPKQAEEMFAQARWLTKDVSAAGDCFRKLAPVVQKQCGPDQVSELLSMLDKVAEAGGGAAYAERQALDQLRRTLTAR